MFKGSVQEARLTWDAFLGNASSSFCEPSQLDAVCTFATRMNRPLDLTGVVVMGPLMSDSSGRSHGV